METVIHSLNYSIDFLVEQIADVSDVQLVTQPSGVPNHPLWTIGHLTFVLQMIGGVIGLRQPPSDAFRRLFGPGSIPVDQPEVYGGKDEAIERLRELQSLVTEAIRMAGHDRLNQPFPDPAYAEVFPTVRHALTQVLIGHTAFHVGQVSVWRKAMGLPPMKRSYE